MSKVKRLGSISISIMLLVSGLNCMGSATTDSFRKDAYKAGIENVAIGGEFLLHDKYNVGDYVVYKRTVIAGGSGTGMDNTPVLTQMEYVYTDRYEIDSISENEVVVKSKNIIEVLDIKVNGGANPFEEQNKIAKEDSRNNEVFYHLDKDRIIQRAYHINKKIDLRAEYKIAQEGDESYIVYKPLPDSKKIELKTDAGTFKTTPLIACWSVSLDADISRYLSTNVKGNSLMIVFSSPKVKFKKVASVTFMVGKGSVDIGIGKLADDIITVLSLTTFVVNPSSILLTPSNNLFKFASSNLLPGKEDVFKSLLKKIPDLEAITTEIQGTMVEYLIEQGGK